MSIEGFWAKRAGFDAWAWDVLRAAAALSPPPPPESASPHADSTRHAGRRGARAAVSGFAVALALAAVLGLSAANPASAAANFVVDDTTDAVDATAADGRCRTAAGKCTLRAAIQQANALPGGDTIVIAEGVYALAIPPLNENLANNGDLDITGPLTIIGAGADDTILDGGEPAAGSPPLIRGLDRLLEIHPSAGDVSISGLTIREGYTAENGGGVYNASNGILSLVEVRLLDSYAAKYGGGVSNGGDGRLNLVHSTLSGNGAKEGGSAVNNAAGGYVAITDGSVVSDNPGTDPLVVPTPLDEYPIGGGAINNEGEGDTIGTIELADSVLSGNVAARDGAGIRNARDGVVIVAGSSIAGNSTSGGGGGIYSVSGTVSVSRDSTISDNHAGNDFSEGSGGAIHHVGRLTKAGVPGRLEIDDAIISANTATGDGGGVFSGLEAELALADATFAGNVAGDEGGGVSSQSKASTTISRVDFSSNVSGAAGGGVYADAEGDVTVTGSNFERNTAGETGGGGLYTDGKAGVAIADSTFERNTAVGDGGGVAIHSDGTITMTDSSVHGNASEEGGGGVENSGSLVTFDRVSVSENSAALDGGGIHNTSSGDFILLESSIRSNTAENGAGFANSPDGMLRISGSEFWDNSARQNGGGLLILGDADIEIVNSTLSGNSAAVSGGGFYTNADAHLLVVNATITANTAPVGSGIALSVESVNFPVVPATPVTLRNTIVADNLDGTDCHGGVFSEGGNLDGGTSCFLQDPSDRTNADPGLEPIALNGGLTRTHALVATSVAVDGGVDPCPETDQRGVTRPQNSRCDIGAYEFDGPATGGEPPPPSDEPDTTPPETTIYSTSPPGLGDATNESTVAEFAFTADEVAIFECALDGETFTNCESPEEYTGLTVGAHTFAVRAIDAAKNVDASPAEYSWTVVDLTAPETTIDSGPLDPTTETSASFQFSANEEGSTFQCALDGAAFADCVSGIQYTGLAVGGHTFEVQAIDAAKNVEESPASHSWTIEAPPSTPDTTPPEVTIVEGPDDETSETSATFRFSVDEPARLECALDGTDIPDCVSPVELTELGLGPHTFVVEATDLVGNHGAASDSWTVVPAPDTSDPETTIDSGPDAVTRSIVAAITFSANEEVSSFKCSLGGASFSDCTSPYTLTDLEDGSYSFEVYAIDAAGNVDDTPAKHSWTVDTVEPETSIDSGPDASTTDTVAEFTFSADEPVSGFECSLDGAGFTSCVTGIEYTDLAVGLHSFEVRASDLAGNVGSASYAWRIEGPPPPTCDAGEVVVDAEADSWVLETSATTNFGNDSVLKIDSKAGGNARTLVRFTRAVIPPGCRLRSATLRLYAGSYKEGRKLHALQVAGQWDENTVTWSNKPQTTGPPAVADSGEGYREWTVTSQIMSMYAGFDNGFLIRDSAEGGVGIEQQFHSREKAPDSPPQLVITFD